MPDENNDSPRRRDDRLQHELLVAYRTVDGFITDWATNISKGGVFINTKSPLSVGTTVKLIVSLPGADFPFDLTGKVTRALEVDAVPEGQSPGMGIAFVDVDDDKMSRIEDFVSRLREALPDEDSIPGRPKG